MSAFADASRTAPGIARDDHEREEATRCPAPTAAPSRRSAPVAAARRPAGPAAPRPEYLARWMVRPMRAAAGAGTPAALTSEYPLTVPRPVVGSNGIQPTPVEIQFRPRVQVVRSHLELGDAPNRALIAGKEPHHDTRRECRGSAPSPPWPRRSARNTRIFRPRNVAMTSMPFPSYPPSTGASSEYRNSPTLKNCCRARAFS